MLKNLLLIILIILGIGYVGSFAINTNKDISGAPPFGLAEEDTPDFNPLGFLQDWKRPDVPPTIGVQVGHWKNNEVPEELKNLKNNTGASGGGKSEAEVNYEIANLIANNLRQNGVHVDILPTTIPPDYWADVFIAIHADGSEDATKSGYKFATSWRDFTDEAESLVENLNNNYGAKTGLEYDPNISRNMRGYYAFAWWRYEHSIHPMTTAVIAETGFLTNYNDRQLIVNNPEISANAISEVLINYLKDKNLLEG